jgi:hypothetical protein
LPQTARSIKTSPGGPGLSSPDGSSHNASAVVDSPEVSRTLRQRLLALWLLLLSIPVFLTAATLPGHEYDDLFAEATHGVDTVFLAGAAAAFVGALAVVSWQIGGKIGQRAGMVNLSQFAKWTGIRIDSARDLDALRAAIDLMAPRVIAWLVAVAAFVAGTLYSREIAPRLLTAAVTALILFLSRL